MAPFLSFDDKGPHSPLTPLVLIHGHPFDRTMWAPQIEVFSAERRVIAPDLRGYGASPVVPGVTPLPRFAEDVRELLDELGVDTFVLGGLSMGGQIAMACLELFGERVRGLLLADTTAAPETDEGRAARNVMAERLLREGMRGYADEVLERMVAPYADAGVKAHVHRMMTATDPRGAAAALRGRAERPDYRPLLARTTVPSLVVVGADDTYTPLPEAPTLPDATLHVIPNAAHLPNLERPAAFNKALTALLPRTDTP
ncbi:alpha/beta fold hydrolase [Streptomyces sp. NPDC005017]|uniref:alpha/beta fold hydrolase n=1 Tax=Streptomyces sp. NPDC005017 TaxID=3364706 RepID=UPI0036C78CD7